MQTNNTPTTNHNATPQPPVIHRREVTAALAAYPGAFYLPHETMEGVILQNLPASNPHQCRVVAYVALPEQDSPLPAKDRSFAKSSALSNPFTLPVEAATVTEMESDLLVFLETGKRPGLPTDTHERAQYEEALNAMNQRLREWLGLPANQYDKVTRHGGSLAHTRA